MHYLDESHLLLFLVQIFLLLASARALGLVFQRFGQPTITAEIVVGIVLGPTIFGRFLPELFDTVFPPDAIQQAMLEALAWLGILFFLLVTGLETNLAAAWKQGKNAMIVSLSDLTIPMAIAFFPCLLLPDRYIPEGGGRLIFSFFVATIMTISALPVTARVLQELKIYKSDAGLLTMCALTINDVAGWIVFAVILGITTEGGMSLGTVSLILAGTLIFSFLSLTVGRRLTNATIDKIHKAELPEPGTSLTFICLLGLAGGAITLKLGIHGLFGFFIAGIMAGESRALPEKTRGIIDQMVRAVLVPLFFASIGLKIDFFARFDPLITAFVVFIGIAGRFVGAWIGVTLTKKFREHRHLIAAAHTPGGEMQIVVGILALEYGVVTVEVFVAIVFGAIASSVILGPWMKWIISRERRVPVGDFFFDRGFLSLRKVATSADVMAALCRPAAEKTGLSPDELFRAVSDRELLANTALGEGLAVPHARIPNLARPVIAVARIEDGVEWNAPDGIPVKLVFLILTPEHDEDQQLAILRDLALVLHDVQNRDRLLNADAPDDIRRSMMEMLGTGADQAMRP